MNKATALRIWNAANPHSELETLETRNSDSLDFHDAGVWGIRRALMSAYGEGAETKEAQYELGKIANYELRVETLSTRNSDSLDFHDVAVWSIHNALRQAAAAGRKARNAKRPVAKTAAPAAAPAQLALFA